MRWGRRRDDVGGQAEPHGEGLPTREDAGEAVAVVPAGIHTAETPPPPWVAEPTLDPTMREAVADAAALETRPRAVAVPVLEPVGNEGSDDDWDGLGGSDPSSSDEGDDDAAPPAALKGGRNLPVATAVGLLLLIGALAAAWFDARAFAIVLYGFSLAGVVEWRRVLRRQDRRIPLLPIVLATIGMGSATWFGLSEGLIVAALVGLAGIVAWRVVDERVENTLADSLASALTVLWIPFLASFLLLMEQADDGWMRVIIFVVAVVGNDTGGLFAGMLWGRTPLLPRVSPKKTWEGLAGGVVLGTVAATVAAWLLMDTWWIGTLVGLVCTAAAVVGDLAESAIKRDVDVKDMSSAIPGHGGVMDRLDSLLLAAPAAYVVFAIFFGTIGRS
ncbi:phosphatidate cytidylyltransferase [Demequina sp. NBRC 110052]|uniref:phosphatidate cytidylyltransferase n=1 Tax=Demequina sp. NBRC 110052 TaxID=1570341 RepID=UPI0009FDA28B|nr:phosphatidate cytidylyltransferase [Demequina sp. NBRC 110052]